jgi:septal ring factor EnvC (AmiA/AmiB activator)
MGARGANKGRRKSSSRLRAGAESVEAVSAPSVDEQLAALKRECENLRQALAAAEARIRSLEDRQNEVANRIAWALDSLRNILETNK